MKLVTLMVSITAKVSDEADTDSLTIEFPYATATLRDLHGGVSGRVV